MLTPQQIQEISFEKAIFGGYDMASVDEVLEPLTEDYLALYKENSVLKSKMRILVEKLEEYRKQEATMQSAILAAQKTCEQMKLDAEKKCARMLRDAEEEAAAKAQNADSLLGTEKERLEAAKHATAQFLDGMERRLNRQLELIAELREQELPEFVPPPEEPARPYDYDREPIAPTPEEKADALIEEISQHAEESIDLPDTLPADADFSVEPPVEPAPAEDAAALHGELSPEKLRVFEELKFGRNNE